MEPIKVDLRCDIQGPVRVRYLDGNLFSMDKAANIINVDVLDNGVPVQVGGSVTAEVIRADGGTVTVSGTVSGNRASVTLPQACYAVVGAISVVIKVTEGTTITTIAAFVANVYRSSTDTIVDPGTIIQSVEDLIEDIEGAVAEIPVAYNASFAPAYSTSSTYAVGQYVTYDGYLWRCTTAITTAESWTSGHWTKVALASEVSDLKSALRFMDSIYGAKTKESFLSMTEVLPNKTVASVNGALKLIDNTGTYVLKVPTSVLSTDPFLIVHPNNMVIVGTTYQIFWSDSDAFTSSARRTFSTDTAVVRRSDANNGNYAYIYIPTSSSTPSYVINRPISDDEVPYDFINTNHNNETGFSVNSSTGILDYGGTAKISQAFWLNDALYASDSINLFVYNTDGSYNTRIVLTIGKNDTSSYSGKIGVIAKSGSKVVTYDINSRVNMINRKYLDSTKFAMSWTGKTLYCYGDSVTQQGYWQPYLNRVCGFASVINGGHSGYRLMSLATTENIDAITDTFDIMIVMAGINDWTQDRQIGTITDVNTDSQSFTGTFYGALNQMLSYLTTKWPARRFVFITPTYVWLNDDSKFYNGTGHGDVNSNGNTMRDFADAMIAACKKWNVPCIDLLSQIGWNKNNISTYVKNDATTTGGVTYANYSHPDWAGAKIMASVIASYLETISPIL